MAQEKAYEEVMFLIGSHGDFTPGSFAKLEYIKACVKESMRQVFKYSYFKEYISRRSNPWQHLIMKDPVSNRVIPTARIKFKCPFREFSVF